VPGTNHVHGRLYEYFQNRNLNAVTSTQAISNAANKLAPSLQQRTHAPALRKDLFLEQIQDGIPNSASSDVVILTLSEVEWGRIPVFKFLFFLSADRVHLL
jgi:hypothetical protein